VVGAAFATLETDASFFARIRERGPRMAEPRKFPYTSPNAAAGDCSAAFGLTGPSFAVGAGLHAALEALIVGAAFVRSGDVDQLVVVGVDDVGPFVTRMAKALGVAATSGVVALVLSADPRGAIASLGPTELGVGASREEPVVCGHHALMPLLDAELPRVLEASSCDFAPSSGLPGVGAWARAVLIPRDQSAAASLRGN
jgi:3-oxoacyl-[acyl-carrier-protein] synthase II